MNYSDSTSGYQAFRKKSLEVIDFDRFISDGGMFQTEMKYYVFTKRNKLIDKECGCLNAYKKRCYDFFSYKIFNRKMCYQFSIDEVPIKYKMSDSSFKSAWIVSALQTMFKLKENIKVIYKENK